MTEKRKIPDAADVIEELDSDELFNQVCAVLSEAERDKVASAARALLEDWSTGVLAPLAGALDNEELLEEIGRLIAGEGKAGNNDA